LAEIAQRPGRKALEELAAVAKPDTLLAWYRKLTDLSQLRAFFGFFALIFMVKASVFSGSPPGSGRVETKCLPFDNALLAVCRWHVSA